MNGDESLEIEGFTFGKIQTFPRTLLSGGDVVAEAQVPARGRQGQGRDRGFSPTRLQEELARTISQLIHVVNTPEARKSCGCRAIPCSSGAAASLGGPVRVPSPSPKVPPSSGLVYREPGAPGA